MREAARECEISLAALTVLGCSCHEQIDLAADAGYSHVGIRVIAATPDEPHESLVVGSTAFRAARQALSASGVAVLDIEILRLTPDVVIDRFRPALETGAAFGARFALVAGNDPDRARMADHFAELCEAAADYGIVPHIEAMPWTSVPTVGDAFALCAASGRTDAGVLIDAFHLARSGGVPADIPVDTSRCGYVQLCDIAGPIPGAMTEVIAEARAGRLYPGDGEIDLPALLRALPPGIPVSVEVPDAAAMAAGRSPRDHAARALEATRRVLDLAS
ncbi:sugar phosphate isomerase/epimerase [Sphingomonas donggukensis]|uniref:Sugar phosphate isomerase/epimerase n=1 Tax=Sphingomonas donggukensis TaxID=2949093 RepID=A0ABY4TTD9_9SPHN|nr:sugar phosphate isomerase/epimerase [Sphingomonas donggukensis]URW75100.1 sugar phosphate isomerase/epimerase [Sphingomonas donggukensis]